MCGIIGLIDVCGSLKHGLNNLFHRGPDVNLIEKCGSDIQFGHTRLSIIDLSSAANQPFKSDDGRYTLVYNGEIYNYRELINKHALSVKTSSDTEVLLLLYIKLGPKCLDECIGMFAGAIYDKLKDEVFLFRDRLGIKPLYYSLEKGGLAFASELPALIELVDKPTAHSVSVDYFLHRGYIPEPLTLYKGVLKFPSGAFALYANGALKITKYWKPEDKIESRTYSKEKQVIDQTHELLIESVRVRLVADVPFGAFLSGGADSGLVSAIAAKMLNHPLKTFNVSFEDAVFDETAYAKEMAQIIGADHHNIKVRKSEVLAQLEMGMRLVGEPFADSSVFPTMAVSKFAAQHVKMALSGDGGDELFMGYGAYAWAQRLNKPSIWYGRHIIAKLLEIKGGGRNARAAQVFKVPHRAEIAAHIFSQEQNLFTAAEIRKMRGSDFRDAFTLPPMARELKPSEAQAFFDLTNYLKDDLLVKVDRASMRHSLEVRVPFLDHRLVEYALNIDPALKTKNGEQKYILKKILERYYPNKLIYRQKWGFSIPLEKWMKDEGALKTQDLGAFSSTYSQLYSKYSNDSDQFFLYNRLYALKICAAYL